MQSIALPESLVAQLRAFETRLRRLETVAALGSGLAGLLVSFVVLFVFDRFGDTPRWARLLLTLTGGGLAASCAHGWARHWLWNRRGPAQLARILQRHFRTLGDRLQGVIELTETGDLPANISPALLRAAIRQVAEESRRFRFDEAAPAQPARRWALAAIVLAALASAPFVFVPRAAANAFARWITPWAKIDRYTFASMEALPRELVVPHGEAFDVRCGLKARSAWKPSKASARLNHQTPQVAPIRGGYAEFHVDGQTQDGVLTISIGDASREVAIHPLHRPEMRTLAASVTLPEYLGYPKFDAPISGSSATFLENSKVSFNGQVTRALSHAALQATDPSSEESQAEVRGDRFITASADIGQIGPEARFMWADQYGLTPAQPYVLRLSTTKDAEPRIDLQGIEGEAAILPSEVVKLRVAASDDFGLKDAWISWNARMLGDKKESLGKGEIARMAGEHTKKELNLEARFSPESQHIPENSVVEIIAYAEDYYPERKPVESWKYTVYVLSPAKHAERIREKMDEVLRDLNERIRDEERQLEETKRIANDKESDSQRSSEDLKRAEAGERANESQTEKLVEEMKDVLRESLRNKEVPEGTVADWQQLTERLQNKATPPMQNASQALQQAAQSPENKEEQLSQAQQEQQKALEAMRDSAGKMNTTNQNLYARNFYNRLRAAAASERQVSDGLKTLARNTVGLKPEEIGDNERKEFTIIAAKQDDTTKDVDKISTDMADFVKRIPNEKYETVGREMQEKRVVAELTELSGYVRANLGLKSVGKAKLWGDRLDAWASMLQSEAHAQGGGNAEVDPDMLELVVAMVRAAQEQDNIRDQTSLLETGKDTNPNVADDAKKLASEQDDLYYSLDELRERTKFNEVKPTLKAAGDMMKEITDDLEEPKTDAEVVGKESTVIELLVPPEKKGGKGDSKMQQMMRQMMAQATRSKRAGGNSSKSTSSFAGEEGDNAASKAASNARSVEKTGAAHSQEWPEEFRDELQAYFQATETSSK